MDKPNLLSIVIIGKNEEEHLESLFKSLLGITIKHEIIYVDSASEDKSILIANQYAEKVYYIEESNQLCAAAGRYVGTKESKGSWILYLDGDMTVTEEFVRYINSREYFSYNSDIAGAVGEYRYIYNDGSHREKTLLLAGHHTSNHFGGAVLLQRAIVLQAGNWNPAVWANEEIDLCARIWHLNKKIKVLDMIMINHFTERIPKINIIISSLFPMNRRYYGFGQVLISQWQAKTLVTFMKMHCYPFLMVVAILLLLSHITKLLFWLPFICLSIIICFQKKAYYIYIYITNVLHGITGIFKYLSFIPKWKRIK